MKNVAVLCVGGGAAGLVTAAYLSALDKSGVHYSQLHGASSGAINAAVYHGIGRGPLREMWLQLKNKDIYKDNPFTWLGLTNKKASCYDSRPLHYLLRDYVVDKRIQEKKDQPLFVSVTDVERERAVSINLTTIKDRAAQWVYASASPPFFFPQVEIHGKQYVDGGLGELVNLSFAIKNGADTIIVLSPRGAAKGTTISNGLEAIQFATRMPLNYMLEKELRIIEIMNSHPDMRQIKTLLIRPDHSGQPGILDFDGWGNFSERSNQWQAYEDQASRQIEAFIST